jgi:hypothetical protein
MGIIDGGVAVGDFDMPPPFQRREHHEQIGDAIAFVLGGTLGNDGGRSARQGQSQPHVRRGALAQRAAALATGPPRFM